MQDFTSVAPSETLTDSREPLLNNDRTAISCSSGTVFPEGYKEVGMLCYRTDEQKLYQLKATPNTWTVIANLRESYVWKAYVDDNFARQEGTFPLRATGTLKVDVGLGNLPNKIDDSITSNNSQSIASSAAAYALNQKIINLTTQVNTNKTNIAGRALLGGSANQNFRAFQLTANSIQSVGDITAYYQATSSDERLKTDITPINDPFERLKDLRGVTYKYISTDEPSIGLIAQDVMKSVPEAVRVDHSGYLSVAYGNLVGLLVEATKNLNHRLEVLEQYAALPDHPRG
ncbi:tail fiber domain-containing protein [Vibrio owensii]|uniref:tail fiber domain-containing protein n=1 Tax=Vibrio owensii TaxID=696485 RepID=UPI00339519EC